MRGLGSLADSVKSRSVTIRGDEFKFSCAHFVAYKNFRERLHGLNYTVEVDMAGPMSEDDGYVIDFGVLKKNIRAICKSLNERVIVPMHSEAIAVTLADSPVLPAAHGGAVGSAVVKTGIIACSTCGEKESSSESSVDEVNKGQVELRCQSSFFSFPAADCALLPIKFSTAEELSAYFCHQLETSLRFDIAVRKISSITVRVFERPTQAASYTISLPVSPAVVVS